jgi:Ca2+:H+ antiporter
MVPAANLLGFAGQEFARKLPHVFGVLIETTIGSVVELILLMVLVKRHQVHVAQDAILGSILANLLLCLGLCFFAGGLRRDEQEFHEAVSETGSNLMLVAGGKFSREVLFQLGPDLASCPCSSVDIECSQKDRPRNWTR